MENGCATMSIWSIRRKSIQLKNFNSRLFSPMVIVGNTDWHEPYVRDLETTKKSLKDILVILKMKVKMILLRKKVCQ